ncbi:MAG: hypothetical protein WCS77_00695 [Elusimicrobiaceae bacterium]|jgi:hypothetical protein
MENFSYVPYLLNVGSDCERDIKDSLKFDLDRRVYHYGGQFGYPFESASRAVRVKAGIKQLLRGVAAKNISLSGSDKIICSAYFSVGSELEKLGFSVSQAPWLASKKTLGKELFSLISGIQNVLSFGQAKDILASAFFEKVKQFRAAYENFVIAQDFKACVLAYDMPFFERETVKLFKKLGKPSAVFLHGLPGRYNDKDDNRADYLFVWGEQIKRNYVKAGVNADKIFVTGRPSVPPSKAIVTGKKGRALVLTKAMGGAQHSSGTVLSDRGNCLLYLQMAKSALLEIGITAADLRLHPSESAAWYENQLGTDFFTINKNSLSESLEKASFVIGPASTVFLEAMSAGVNYFIFEPSTNGLDLLNYPLVNPFDGSDKRVPVFSTESELVGAIRSNSCPDSSFFCDYIQNQFDISVAKILFK